MDMPTTKKQKTRHYRKDMLRDGIVAFIAIEGGAGIAKRRLCLPACAAGRRAGQVLSGTLNFGQAGKPLGYNRSNILRLVRSIV